MSNVNVNFKANDRVMTIQNNKARYGTIYGLGKLVAIVEFKVDNSEGFELEKINLSDLILVDEPAEKTVITVNSDEFKETGIKVIAKLVEKNPKMALSCLPFLVELHKALFFEDVTENP